MIRLTRVHSRPPGKLANRAISADRLSALGSWLCVCARTEVGNSFPEQSSSSPVGIFILLTVPSETLLKASLSLFEYIHLID